MINKGTDFPQYRKLSNNKVFYKILDDRNFEELQIVGTKCFLYNVNASKYPEILRISEMISLTLPNFEKIQSEEYEKIKGGL
jgi:hypothetical protein